MPGLVFVGYSTGRDHFLALAAPRGKLFLVALGTINFFIFWNETLRADWRLAMCTAKTFVMPLLPLVLHLLHPRTEDLIAAVAPRGKCIVVAVGTEDSVILRAERLIHQRDFAHIAEEAVLMPVLVFVGKILRVDTDAFGAFVALVGENLLVAFDAVRVLIPKYVPLSSEC